MMSEDAKAFARKLDGFPEREPRLDEQASAAHGMPLESLEKVRRSQPWSHAGAWFDPREVRDISSGAVTMDDALAARLGLDGLRDEERRRTLSALRSRHGHRVDLLAPFDNAALDLHLSRDGFAGWADPGLSDVLTGNGDGMTRLLRGERQFVSGPWTLLPRLVSSWAGIAPAWSGWRPLRVPGSVIDARLQPGAETRPEPSGALEEAGPWWLVRLSGAGMQSEPWLVSERIGCMAITGEPGSADVTLIQVNGLSVFSSFVSYWDAALTGLSTELR